jgi:hypothetical protein
MNETGYVQKKYIAVNACTGVDGDGNDIVDSYSRVMYGSYVNSDYQLNNTQDLVTMRFADVLLMAAELNEDAAPLNRVRARVGLAPVAYSATALQNERRWELAFEGVRYHDLLRWGLAGEALNKQNGVEVDDIGVTTAMNLGDQVTRINETGGFMPIPSAEIDLSDGVLVQTPGW